MNIELNIEVPGIYMKSFVKALNRGNIPVSIYVEDPPKELYYIKLVYDENFEYIGIKDDIDKPQPGKSYKTYLTAPYFHLPPEIQSDIVSRTKQKNCIGFLLSISSGAYNGGFTWDKSPEGHCFWDKILNDKDYDVYFEKYPKEIKVSKEFDETMLGVHSGSDFEIIDWDKFKTISTRADDSSFKVISDTKCNDTFLAKCYNDYEIQQKLYNLLKIEEDESRLQKQKADLSGRDGAKSVRVCNRRNKTRVAKFSLGYKEISGRS